MQWGRAGPMMAITTTRSCSSGRSSLAGGVLKPCRFTDSTLVGGPGLPHVVGKEGTCAPPEPSGRKRPHKRMRVRDASVANDLHS